MQPWQTALVVTGSVIGAAAVLGPIVAWLDVFRLEKPKYTVLRPLGTKKHLLTGKSVAELRRYAPMLIAEVTVSGTMKEATSNAFRQIAGFIFGKNSPAGASGSSSSSSEKIAMTSPVRMEVSEVNQQQQAAGKGESVAMTSPVRMVMAGSGQGAAGSSPGDSVVMSFVMPSKYTADTLPRPENDNVKIKEVPAHTVASLGFSGWIRGPELVERKKQELLGLLQAEGLTPVGDVMLYQYHPPFTFGFLRHNEVLFNINEGTTEK